MGFFADLIGATVGAGAAVLLGRTANARKCIIECIFLFFPVRNILCNVHKRVK